jgi:hypothetical protein
MTLKFKTDEEAREFLRKVMGPPKRQLVGKELEDIQFLMDMCEPISSSNNQRTITDEYLIGGRRYDVTYFPGLDEEPIVEVYEDDTDIR